MHFYEENKNSVPHISKVPGIFAFKSKTQSDEQRWHGLHNMSHWVAFFSPKRLLQQGFVLLFTPLWLRLWIRFQFLSVNIDKMHHPAHQNDLKQKSL